MSRFSSPASFICLCVLKHLNCGLLGVGSETIHRLVGLSHIFHGLVRVLLFPVFFVTSKIVISGASLVLDEIGKFLLVLLNKFF